jgi:hypothetical protein
MIKKHKYKMFILLYFLSIISLCASQLSPNSSIASQPIVVRSVPILSAKSRLLNGLSLGLQQMPSVSGGSVASPSSRIHYEHFKALVGETVRLECPQPNPTWFFRRANRDSPIVNDGSGTEDLIVTRHGIINADYKYKIMCHVTLKHKVIVVNNIEFEDEGLYTCLYTIPNEKGSEYLENSNPVQYRFVFNVTVYSKHIFLISTLYF